MWQLWELLRADEPAVVRTCPFAQALTPAWTLKALGVACPEGAGLVQVLCAPAERGVFLIDDAAKNVHSGIYHVREPPLQRLTMPMAGAAQVLRTWAERKAFAQIELLQAPQQQGEVWPNAKLGFTPELRAALDNGLAWPWLQEQQAVHGLGRLTSLVAEAASPGSLRPPQYDVQDRILFQVAGRKRLVVFPPSQAFEGLYPFAVAHPFDTYAMPDFEKPDLAAWPLLDKVRGRSAVLQPGNACIIPAFWFLAIEELDSGGWALAARFGLGSRLPGHGALALVAARAVETHVGAVQGPEHVRRWLTLIGQGREQEAMDLGSVAGYVACVMCEEVRDEIAACLGPGEPACAALLAAMCRGRLVPTPWLNKGFREPLYLMDAPVTYEDQRTPEEIKYPEFFRHRALVAPPPPKQRSAKGLAEAERLAQSAITQVPSC